MRCCAERDPLNEESIGKDTYILEVRKRERQRERERERETRPSLLGWRRYYIQKER